MTNLGPEATSVPEERPRLRSPICTGFTLAREAMTDRCVPDEMNELLGKDCKPQTLQRHSRKASVESPKAENLTSNQKGVAEGSRGLQSPSVSIWNMGCMGILL